MERKANSYSTNVPKPFLLRRRLSTPETIMRKQHLASREDEDIQLERKSSHINIGSDTNLSRKRETDLKRQTLIRNIKSNNKPLPSTYYEWKRSLEAASSEEYITSTHSSPEHKRKISNNSAYRLRLQRNILDDRSRKSSLNSLTCSNKNLVSIKAEEDRFRKRSLNSLISNNNNLKFDDSRLKKSSLGSLPSCNNNNVAYDKVENIIFPKFQSTKVTKQISKYDDASGSSSRCSHYTENVNHYTTKLDNSTNLQVIANVNLSQNTLDLIFNKVIEDMSNKNTEVNFSTVEVETLKQTVGPEQSGINQKHEVKDNFVCLEKEIGINNNSIPEINYNNVPSSNNLPKKSSIKASISKHNSEDDSDAVSLVDSLENNNSPKLGTKFNHDEKLVRGVTDPVVCDKKNQTSTSFFIPIESNIQKEKVAMSDLLPGKVRDRLDKRQQTRENKMTECRNKSSISLSDQIYFSLSKANKTASPISYKRIKVKPLLPSLQSNIRHNKEPQFISDKRNYVKYKSISANPDLAQNYRTKNKLYEKLSPIKQSNYDFSSYHKLENQSNGNKRIEIIEIREYVETDVRQSHKGKTKIPVLVRHSKSSRSISSEVQTTNSLDVDNNIRKSEEKLDQLIANILIDTLNNIEDNSEKINEIKENVIEADS